MEGEESVDIGLQAHHADPAVDERLQRRELRAIARLAVGDARPPKQQKSPRDAEGDARVQVLKERGQAGEVVASVVDGQLRGDPDADCVSSTVPHALGCGGGGGFHVVPLTCDRDVLVLD